MAQLTINVLYDNIPLKFFLFDFVDLNSCCKIVQVKI